LDNIDIFQGFAMISSAPLPMSRAFSWHNGEGVDVCNVIDCYASYDLAVTTCERKRIHTIGM
jgi:hypothetical protein